MSQSIGNSPTLESKHLRPTRHKSHYTNQFSIIPLLAKSNLTSRFKISNNSKDMLKFLNVKSIDDLKNEFKYQNLHKKRSSEIHHDELPRFSITSEGKDQRLVSMVNSEVSESFDNISKSNLQKKYINASRKSNTDSMNNQKKEGSQKYMASHSYREPAYSVISDYRQYKSRNSFMDHLKRSKSFFKDGESLGELNWIMPGMKFTSPGYAQRFLVEMKKQVPSVFSMGLPGGDHIAKLEGFVEEKVKKVDSGGDSEDVKDIQFQDMYRLVFLELIRIVTNYNHDLGKFLSEVSQK